MFKKVLFLFIIMQMISAAQNFQWVKSYPTTIETNPFYLRSEIDVDSDGNPASSHILQNRQLYGQDYFGDYLIVKRNPEGIVIWQDTLFGKANIFQLQYDNNGNLYGAGTFRDSIYFTPAGLISTTMVNHEGFVFKMNSIGDILWIKKASQLAQNIYYEMNLALDSGGNFWISSSDNQLNSTIQKFNADGLLLFTITQTNVRYISTVDFDNQGYIWVTGSTFEGNVWFNGYNSIAPFTYTEYLVKYSPSGQCQWVRYIKDITLQQFKIVCDNSGSGYLSGNLFDSTWFGNIKAYGPLWVYDFFLTKVDGNGNFLWLREVPQGNTAGDASIGNGNFLSYFNGNVYVTGFLRFTVNFGGGIVVSSSGSNDILILKYSSEGELQWAKNAGGISDDIGSSIINDNFGNIYLSGRIRAEATFDTITVQTSSLTTFISKLHDDIIPVELISFNGSALNNGVELSWSTASEKNNKGFEIYRSSSTSSDWMTLGFIQGNGTTTEKSFYKFFDETVLTGTYLYRLKQIDFNGSFEYSDIIQIEAGSPIEFSLFQNYPNPFNPVTTLSYSLPVEGFVNLSVYNSIGERVTVLIDEYKSAGIYNISFNAEKLRSGVYFYRLTSGDYTSTQKMIFNK